MPQKMLAKYTLALSLLGSVTSYDFLDQGEKFRESTVLNSSVPLFRGNTTHRDYFKLLREDTGSVLVGARNIIYNLSLVDLTENIQEVRPGLSNKKNFNIFCIKKLDLKIYAFLKVVNFCTKKNIFA